MILLILSLSCWLLAFFLELSHRDSLRITKSMTRDFCKAQDKTIEISVLILHLGSFIKSSWSRSRNMQEQGQYCFGHRYLYTAKAIYLTFEMSVMTKAKYMVFILKFQTDCLKIYLQLTENLSI